MDMHIRKIKDKFQYWGWQQGKKFNSKAHELSYFFWEATDRCNLYCRHCGSECTKSGKLPELSSARVIEVFRDIAENYDPQKIMVAVTGGEPLVREDLFQVLSQINEMGFPWGMVTNGMLVDQEIVEKCGSTGMRTVSVSVDGVGPTHNWLRNNELSYQKAIAALELFINSGRFKIVEAITCVNERNINELDQLYDILKNIGVNGWRLFTIFPKGRAENNNELIINEDLLKKLLDFIAIKRLNNNGMYVSYSEEGYLGCEWERKVRDDFFFCGAGINIAGLLCDGTYSACPSLSREWSQGHVSELLFSKAWETRYINMRNRDWMKGAHCGNCDEWKNCQGSSLHLWNWQQCKPDICHFRLLNS